MLWTCHEKQDNPSEPSVLVPTCPWDDKVVSRCLLAFLCRFQKATPDLMIKIWPAARSGMHSFPWCA